MELNGIELGKRLILAPMAEITDAPFRKIAKEFGAGLTFTQMVSAEGILKNNFESLKLFSFNQQEKPIGVQLLGNDPVIIGQAVNEISRFKPDIIDFNAGCPVKKVTDNKMGSSILDYPDLLGRIVKSMSDNSHGIPISVKFRLGKEKKKINIIKNAKIAEDNGASILTIHARTKIDRYSAEPIYEWIAKVKQSVSVPVIGNGSVFSPLDAKNLIEQTGCDAIMVARGSIGNPFIFSRFYGLITSGKDPGEPSVEIIKKTLLMHIDLLIKEYGEFAALDKAKKHSIWYFMYLSGINFLLKRIFAIKNIESLKELIDYHSLKIEKNLYPKEDNSEILLKFKKKVLFWLLDE